MIMVANKWTLLLFNGCLYSTVINPITAKSIYNGESMHENCPVGVYQELHSLDTCMCIVQ